MTDGYIIVCMPTKAKRHAYEALSYGKPHEPAPDTLLMRDRVTLFTSKDAVFQALDATLASQEPWVRKHMFWIMDVESHD